MCVFFSVLIGDFGIAGSIHLPDKTDSALIVNANAALPSAFSLEMFQPVPWRDPQLEEIPCRFHLIKLAQGNGFDAAPAFACALRKEFEGRV
jgi:hypothetical protein